MTEIGKGYVRIIPTAEGIEGKITKMLAPESEKAGQSGGASFAAGLKGALLKLGIGAMVGKFFKESLEAGGALQQSFGGLDTLYGDASAAMKDYAMAAAQAGISANDYAEQAVSFGASLKSAFGGDMVKAAEAANTAIMDMADNSAKMGTDITAIQTAYQGFAKQNYTMLDNLKLGYGGTKTEMERLLKDATKLSGVKYDINNLGDVYAAIHVIQENLGLTGVAAKEASETFSGSLNAMKSSLENLMASMSLGMDITPALQGLITSASDFLFKNLIPMLLNILTSLPGALMSAIPTVVDTIMAQLTTYMGGQSVGQLIQSGFDMFMGWLTGFLQGLPQMMTTAGEVINSLVAGFMVKWPEIQAKGVEMLTTFISGIAQNLPQIITTGAKVIAQFLATIGAHLPQILQKGVEIILQLVAGIIRSIPDVVRAIPQVISGIRNAFERHDWGAIGRNLIKGIGEGIKNGVTGLVDSAIQACKSLTDSVKSFFGIASPSKLWSKEIGRWLPPGLANGITGNLSPIYRAMDEVESAMMIDSPSVSLRSSVSSGTSYDAAGTVGSALGGFQQNITINSPQELSPSEVARQTRNATKQMVLSMSGV